MTWGALSRFCGVFWNWRSGLNLRCSSTSIVIEFADVRLARDASDRTVWETCQAVGAVLITGNRASGTESLEQTIRDHAGPDSLPVVTISDPQRVVRDRVYARECAVSLLDLLDRLETLRGTRRLFIP